MKFGIVANPEKAECIRFAKEVYERIPSIVVEEETARRIGIEGVPLEEMNVDVIITIGGDGTILRTLQRTRSKILGVNMGLLGFLTEIKPSEIWDAIERIKRGDYYLDERMKIKVTLNGKRLYDCTNEVVIHTAEIAKLRSYVVYFNDELLEDLRADGIIIATPTGSTSYALSAGGPILHPHCESVVITPIAPFKKVPRSFVLPAERVRIELKDGRRNLLVLDGQESIEIEDGDIVEIEKSENYASFIRFKNPVMLRIREEILK